jgi:hypothetical protein
MEKQQPAVHIGKQNEQGKWKLSYTEHKNQWIYPNYIASAPYIEGKSINLDRHSVTSYRMRNQQHRAINLRTRFSRT